MKLHIKRKINIVFGLALLILLVIGVVSYRSISQLVTASQQVAHSRDITEALSAVFSNLQDAETGERGFVITEDDAYLEPYRSARASIDEDLQHLDSLIPSGSDQRKVMNKLKTVSAARVKELDRIIEIRRTQGLEPARRQIRENRGKQLMDEARTLVASMEAIERQVLQQKGEQVKANARNTAWIISIGSLLGFTIIPLSIIVIHNEIGRRESIEQDLIRARDEAERSNRFKDQFLSTMSHELRTPLNAVLGFSDLLKEERYGSLNERQMRYLTHIHKGGEHLLKLINDILDLSKIEAGRMDLSLENTEIQAIFDEAVDTLRPLAAEKNQELVYSAAPDLTVRVDRTRFKQILMNLAGNAIKFTPEFGRIYLSAGRSHTQVKISVHDNGPGIPAEEQQRIFEGFYRLRGTAKSIEGTGLGLAICRRLVSLHGAQLAVESEPNQGTCFYFELPEVPTPVRAKTSDTAHYEQRQSGSILVIEDDPVAADLIQSHLTSAGYQVVICKQPELAMSMAADLQPQAITLDILMSPVTGWDLLVKLRGDPVTARIPIVVVTIVDQRSLGATLGADEYLIKPVEKASLISAVERCLHQRNISTTAGHALVVEDDADTRELLAELLTEQGYQVTTAEDGKEAREKMAEFVPLFVVLDLLLPKVSGFDLLAEWRANKRTADLPVFVVTSKDLSREEESFLRAQTEMLLQKEVHWKTTLLSQVQRIISQQASAFAPVADTPAANSLPAERS